MRSVARTHHVHLWIVQRWVFSRYVAAAATNTDEPWRDSARGIPAPPTMTQKQLADHLGCDVKVVNGIVNGGTSVSAWMALRLGPHSETRQEFWLNAQEAVDLHRASKPCRSAAESVAQSQ